LKWRNYWINKVLEMPAKTKSHNDEKRTYRNLLKGRFDVKVCRIDMEDDNDYWLGLIYYTAYLSTQMDHKH
jgi:hypothetical protein